MFEQLPSMPGSVQSRRPDITKLRSIMPDYNPMSFEEGIRQIGHSVHRLICLRRLLPPRQLAWHHFCRLYTRKTKSPTGRLSYRRRTGLVPPVAPLLERQV